MQTVKDFPDNTDSDTQVDILFTDPIVEYNINSISYDGQSLIGEIGGTLGLTLGLSGFSLVDFLLLGMRKIFRLS